MDYAHKLEFSKIDSIQMNSIACSKKYYKLLKIKFSYMHKIKILK